MFRSAALIALLLCSSTLRTLAAGADDLFITIYNQIQQADAQAVGGHQSDAYAGYARAQDDLRQLQRQYPMWNERVINYRLRYVADKLEALRDVAEVPSPVTPKPANPAAPADLAPSGEVISQFNAMNEQIRRLNVDKGLLEARLREALSAQPAPVDPRQLHEAVEEIAALRQSNKLLVARLEDQQEERKGLIEKVMVEETQKALNEANRQLLEQHMALNNVTKSKAEVEAQLRALQSGPLKKLEGENTLLKQQVTELKSETERGRQVAELAGKLSRLQTQMDDLKKQNDSLVQEKAALEKHLADTNVRKAEENIVRISRLETDLALAQADALRKTQTAEALAGALTQAKATAARLEERNKSLEVRVAALTQENSTANTVVRRLQAALDEEKAERAQLEQRLKAAEQLLAGLPNASSAGAVAIGQLGPSPATVRPVDPDLLAKATLLETEVRSLRSALRESQAREADVRTLLAEEQSMRSRLQRERVELDRKLAALSAGPTNAPLTASVAVVPATRQSITPAAQVTASLERRVQELETERENLQRRLAAAGVSLETRMVAARSTMFTPREHAADRRLRR